MEVLQSAFSALNWPTSFAIVASIATITTAVFGYLIKTRSVAKDSIAPPEDISHIHTRISELKDRVSLVESDVKVVLTKLEAIEKQFSTHEDRDERDFERLNDKVDKLTDVLMKVLQDEKL